MQRCNIRQGADQISNIEGLYKVSQLVRTENSSIRENDMAIIIQEAWSELEI